MKRIKMEDSNLDYYRNLAKKDTEKQRFYSLCLNAENAKDLLTITSIFENAVILSNDWYYRQIYNRFIGWGLASYHTCKLIYDYWLAHSECCIVDLGAGRGIFCCILHFLGIPKEKLIAIDLHIEEKTFWPIQKVNENYQVPKDAILFISWGSMNGSSRPNVDDYVARGGSQIIILGETEGGCTLESDCFKNHSQFEEPIMNKVVGPFSIDGSEFLSFNIRKKTQDKLYYWDLDLSFYLDSFNDEKLTDEIIKKNFNGNANDVRQTILNPNEYRDPKIMRLKPAIWNENKKQYFCQSQVHFGPTRYTLNEMVDLIQKSIAGSEPWVIVSKLTNI